MSFLLDDFTKRAWAASNKASDVGAQAFQTHTGYSAAYAANASACTSWRVVKSIASKENNPAAAQDAEDRVEELVVAAAALKEDSDAHGGGKPGAYVPKFVSLSAPTGTGVSSKWWLWAAGAAVAAKVLGFL